MSNIDDEEAVEIFVEENLCNGLVAIKSTGKTMSNKSQRRERKGAGRKTVFDRLSGEKDSNGKPYYRKPTRSVFSRLSDKEEPPNGPLEDTNEQSRLLTHSNATYGVKPARKVRIQPMKERVEQVEVFPKPTEVAILESIAGPETVEKTKAEIKEFMQKTFPKAHEEVYDELITKQMPMTTTEHARIFIRLCQAQTNNPTLAKLNQIAAAAHVQIMREINHM